MQFDNLSDESQPQQILLERIALALMENIKKII